MEVFGTDEFETWYEGLDAAQAAAVRRVVELLALRGVELGFPYSSALKLTRHPLRELRAGTGRTEIRVIYAFDPCRDAILLIGGVKTSGRGFYARIVRAAERVWLDYLAEQAAGRHD